MQKELNITELKDKLYKRLEPSGWALKLRGFIYSNEFDTILITLVNQVNANKRFTPALKDVFSAFEKCPVNELKVVMIGQDPYPQINVADGLAFSCSKSEECMPAINFLLNEVNRTVYKGHPISTDPDLTRWAEQGILLLNSALTTVIGKVGEHYDIWKPFITYLFDYLSLNCPGLVYIFVGKQAQNWEEHVNENCHKFLISHPASAVYNKTQTWNSENVFTKTQKIIQEVYNYSIIW
jgi:uracil-DNA glycosylase